MIAHVGELAGYLLHLSLVDFIGLFLSDIGAIQHHAADFLLRVLPGSGPGQGHFIFIVSVALNRAAPGIYYL